MNHCARASCQGAMALVLASLPAQREGCCSHWAWPPEPGDLLLQARFPWEGQGVPWYLLFP